MARPVEFDRKQAVHKAQQLFWAQGYSVSSLSQLLAAMGIGKSSFYAAFGDKRSLFIDCLELFYGKTRRILENAMAQHSPSQAIEVFFDKTMLSEQDFANGCMMVNTVLELASVDEALSQLAADYLTAIKQLFEHCISEAQQQGEVARTLGADVLATNLMVINQGMRVASRSGLSRDQLKHTLQCALASSGFPVH